VADTQNTGRIMSQKARRLVKYFLEYGKSGILTEGVQPFLI